MSVCAKSLQSCPTLCNPMDCSSLGSSVHGILQARILEYVAISYIHIFISYIYIYILYIYTHIYFLYIYIYIYTFPIHVYIYRYTYTHNGILFSLKKEILPFATTWLNLEDILLSKPVTERKKWHNLTYMWNLRNKQKQRLEWWLPGTGRCEEWGDTGHRVQNCTYVGWVSPDI